MFHMFIFCYKYGFSIADETGIFLYLPQMFVFYYFDFIVDDCSMLQIIVLCYRSLFYVTDDCSMLQMDCLGVLLTNDTKTSTCDDGHVLLTLPLSADKREQCGTKEIAGKVSTRRTPTGGPSTRTSTPSTRTSIQIVTSTHTSPTYSTKETAGKVSTSTYGYTNRYIDPHLTQAHRVHHR